MALDRKQLVKPVKKLRKLVSNLDHDLRPEAVHCLRTNTRRFEAEFEALSLDRLGARKSILKNLRQCRKRAGKVRDLDVLTSHAATVRPQGEEECSVRLLEYLGAQRRKYGKKLYAEVKHRRPIVRKGLKSVKPLLAKLTGPNHNAKGSGAAGSSAAASAVALAVQLAAPHRLNRGNLHPYRLKVKELRNILRMTRSDSRFVDDLGKVKDAIGEWHDWEELVSIAEKTLDHGKQCELVAELKRIAARKYEHALSLAHVLRKEYLRTSSQKNGGATPAVPLEPVWQAIAMLTG